MIMPEALCEQSPLSAFKANRKLFYSRSLPYKSHTTFLKTDRNEDSGPAKSRE